MPDIEQSKFVQFMSRILRPLNFLGGIGTITVALMLFFIVHHELFRNTLNLMFTGLLGLLLLAGEFNIGSINRNCKFLITYLGRGLFDIFVGGWVYNLHIGFSNSGSINKLGSFTSLIVYIVNYNFLFFAINTILFNVKLKILLILAYLTFLYII